MISIWFCSLYQLFWTWSSNFLKNSYTSNVSIPLLLCFVAVKNSGTVPPRLSIHHRDQSVNQKRIYIGGTSSFLFYSCWSHDYDGQVQKIRYKKIILFFQKKRNKRKFFFFFFFLVLCREKKKYICWFESWFYYYYRLTYFFACDFDLQRLK